MKLLRDVMADIPELRRFCARLGDPDFPTPAEVADARHVLARDRGEQQPELDLKPQ